MAHNEKKKQSIRDPETKQMIESVDKGIKNN